MGRIDDWAIELGYDKISGTLLRAQRDKIDVHPFAPELRAILEPGDRFRGEAVVCVDNVPTVCLVTRELLDQNPVGRRQAIRGLCEKLWNQNLVRVVLVLDGDKLEAWSVDNPSAEPQSFASGAVDTEKTWSISGLVGGEALRGRDSWFSPQHRVDRTLLDNVRVLLDDLEGYGIEGARARRLLARIIFVTYLEDRQIVGDNYRSRRRVRPLLNLIAENDAAGLGTLFRHLRRDFNGDFLSSAEDEGGWHDLPDAAFERLADFLNRTVLRSNQLSFWRYDFSQIPIELIASIYETFLGAKDAVAELPASQRTRRRQGAFYTPRVLADWVVNQALAGRDVLQERIFDPACGSGMLLTAAYRKLIRAHEARSSRRGGPSVSDFVVRRQLLLEHIFGGDIDEDACQLTGFSLYLALLSDLSPSDLELLREGGHKLPSLTNNIRRGAEGNFLSDEAQQLARENFTVFLSNPPWRQLAPGEPAATELRNWQARQPKPTPHIPKMQIAAAFALASADCVRPGGRIALILPVKPFVSTDPTQLSFRTHLVGRLVVREIINFSDMRRLIFADSAHPFIVLIAEARPKTKRFESVDSEFFEYWTPKSDISLALGRLAVHGGDRATLATSTLLDDVGHLSIQYWGSTIDASLLQRLQRHGRIRDLIELHGWQDGKGFHLTDEDRRRPRDSWYIPVPRWMERRRFLAAEHLPDDSPVVSSNSLQPFPFDKIAREPPRRFCEGPRILWTDGAHPSEGVRAIYAEDPFTFRHSLAVLSAPDGEDARLTARFLVAYLRSPLGLWLLLLLSSSVASERPKLHVQEALDWPFWPLSTHPRAKTARRIATKVSGLLTRVEAASDIVRHSVWKNLQPTINRLVYEYFGLTRAEIVAVEELAEFAGPALQPPSLTYNALRRPLRNPPTKQMIAAYCEVLEETIRTWRDVTGGEGDVSVSSWTAKSIPIGAAVIELERHDGARNRAADDTIVDDLADALHRVLGANSDMLLTVPDLAVVEGRTIYLVKPLVSRFWLKRSAIEDAGELALRLQAVSKERAST